MLRDSRSRHVERNDDIPYSSKFLWSGMFVIEVINHVIVVVLLEICIFHLRLTLLYRGIILPSVWYYNRQDSIAGFFVFHVFLAGACHLEIVRLRPMEQTQMQAGIRNNWLAHHLKRS